MSDDHSNDKILQHPQDNNQEQESCNENDDPSVEEWESGGKKDRLIYKYKII